MNFWRGVFTDNGSPSSSRVLTAVHSLAGVVAFLFITFHNKALPDAATMAGLGAFATVHYAVNAVRNMFGNNSQPQPGSAS